MFGAAQQTAKAADAAEHVVDHARRSGNLRGEVRGAIVYVTAAVYGPTPVAEAIIRTEELVEHASADQHAVATLNLLLAELYAMRGEFEHARSLYRGSQAKLLELRAGIYASATSLEAARVELLAGDHAAAEQLLRTDFDALTGLKERYVLSTIAGLLGRVLETLDRAEEADKAIRTAEEISAPDDLDAQPIWRGTRARLLARDGQYPEAERFAREAVAMREQADTPILLAEALIDLAVVLDRASRPADADAVLAEALTLAQRKGDDATASQVLARRATLRPVETKAPRS